MSFVAQTKNTGSFSAQSKDTGSFGLAIQFRYQYDQTGVLYDGSTYNNTSLLYDGSGSKFTAESKHTA